MTDNHPYKTLIGRMHTFFGLLEQTSSIDWQALLSELLRDQPAPLLQWGELELRLRR